MFIQTQTTPNPATLKFLPGQDVSPATPYEFARRTRLRPPRWPRRCSASTASAGVFFGSDFVSITKSDDADWAVVKPQALAAIMDHFVSGAPLLADAAPGAQAPADRGRHRL